MFNQQEAQRVLDELWGYVSKTGHPAENWYVGIASDPKDCLFNRHGVDRGGVWFHMDAATSENARAVEQTLLKSQPFKGGPGGGDDSTRHVYAYVVTGKTRQ